MDNITDLLDKVEVKIKLESKKRIFENEAELKSSDLKEPQDPEEFTRSFLIDEILFNILRIELIGRNRKFDTPTGERKVDYALKYAERKFLIEAKAINKDLYEKSKDGAVNQIKGAFTLADVKLNYNFGIATDGLIWIFINDERKIIDELDLREDFQKIKSYLIEKKPIPKKTER